MALMLRYIVFFIFIFAHKFLWADPNYPRALKRAAALLNLTTPNDTQLAAASNNTAYQEAVRGYLNHANFYEVMLRYHELLFGTGLPLDRIDELMRVDIDYKANKFAQIICGRKNNRFECVWASEKDRSQVSSCAVEDKIAVSAFWYPGKIFAWVCPSIAQSCGYDLSRCFIEYSDATVAANSELGTTEAFDSRYSVIKSLSKQSAGLATAVVVANYPYTDILRSGLTAIDGAIAHFYRQSHHFDLTKLNIPQSVIDIANRISLNDTRFHLVNAGESPEQGGVLSTFGWLRRYEKNRTRANQLYSRLLCRQFTAELPKIFPSDPGNLRTASGCSGCHATLDPLADFFHIWGQGGELYSGLQDIVDTTFGGKDGSSLADLARIIREDDAFAACAVQHVWSWLIGREFFASEAPIRAGLTKYFITTNYSFRELVFATATHPNFIEGERTNALVTDPLTPPPLGQTPQTNTVPPCAKSITFAADIEPKISTCATAGCHVASNSQNLISLSSEADWQKNGQMAVQMMASGQMPVGASGPPLLGPIYDLKENVRCWLLQK